MEPLSNTPDNLDVAKLYIGHLEARVKKLEADLETIDTEAKAYFEKYVQAWARVKELEAALQDIVDFCDDPDPPPVISLALGLSRILPAARRALAQAEKPNA